MSRRATATIEICDEPDLDADADFDATRPADPLLAPPLAEPFPGSTNADERHLPPRTRPLPDRRVLGPASTRRERLAAADGPNRTSRAPAGLVNLTRDPRSFVAAAAIGLLLMLAVLTVGRASQRPTQAAAPAATATPTATSVPRRPTHARPQAPAAAQAERRRRPTADPTAAPRPVRRPQARVARQARRGLSAARREPPSETGRTPRAIRRPARPATSAPTTAEPAPPAPVLAAPAPPPVTAPASSAFDREFGLDG